MSLRYFLSPIFSLVLLSGTTLLQGQSQSGALKSRTIEGSSYLQIDLNGDGAPDLIGTDGINLKAAFEVEVSNGDGTYQGWVPYYPVNSNEIVQSVAVGDLNGDGKGDVIVSICACGGATPGIEIFLGNGDGTLQAPLNKIALPYGAGIAATDVNHDDHLDLVLLGNNNVNVLYGAGDGTFSAPVSVYDPGTYNLEDVLLTGDFDGDTNADIVVEKVLCSQGLCDYRLTTLYGNGQGQFTPVDLSCSACDAQFYTVADINEDGKSDLVLYDQIFYGSASRNFQLTTFPAIQYPFLAVPGMVGVADLNGDGVNDLAFTAEKVGVNESFLAHEFGASNGSFSNPVLNAFTSYNASALRIGDYNNDQKPDVLVDTAAFNGPAIVMNLILNPLAGNFSKCQTPAPVGARVCAPLNGVNVTSPVAFDISAASFQPIRKIETWVDGVKKAETYYGWDVKAFSRPKITLAKGTHHADIYSVDVDNTPRKTSVDFTVK